MMWQIHDNRRWFGVAARLSDAELRDLELRALRTDAARAAIAEEAAVKRRPGWLRRAARRAFRRMRGK
ncbi:MAG: hypothetical protein WBF43_12905 [Methylocella sp.]